jgi:hypothetical protein
MEISRGRGDEVYMKYNSIRSLWTEAIRRGLDSKREEDKLRVQAEWRHRELSELNQVERVSRCADPKVRGGHCVNCGTWLEDLWREDPEKGL